jgi:hypothetical protein
MRTWRVVWKIYLYSISVHRLLSKSRVTVATAAVMLPTDPAKWHTYSVPDIPQKEKNQEGEIRRLR